jgi:toxin ParE1/3/4
VSLRVKYSLAARRDLLSIKAWTAQKFGRAQSAIYVRQVEAAMQLISNNPGLARSAGDLSPGLFKTFAGSHIVYFRNTGEVINVIRVLHEKMKPENWL